MWKRAVLALLALAFAPPAAGLQLQSTPAPGRRPPSLEDGEIAINRADRSLFFKNIDGTIGVGSLLNATAAGRRAVEEADASGLSVKAPGAQIGQPLSTWMSTPHFAAMASPLNTNAYDSYNDDGTPKMTGWAGAVVRSSDSSKVGGKERYGTWFVYDGAGTGYPDVIASTFAVGISNLKKNWHNTTVPGQTIGAHITTRCGYHGPLAATMPAEFGGYYPGGDCAGLIMNAVQSSPYASQQAMELSIHYAKNGVFSPAGDLHSMNIQFGAMRQKNGDGTTANPGVGVSVTAASGQMAYAYQAINTARPGTYHNDVPGYWGGFLLYSRDDGTRAYDAWKVTGDGSNVLCGTGTTTPCKTVRVSPQGAFQVANNAGTTVFSVSDAGVPTFGANEGAWTAYSGSLQFDAGSTAAGTFNGRYEILGKKLTLSAIYSVSAAGASPGGAVYVPLPAGLAVGFACPGSGNEYALSGKMLNVRAIGGATQLTLVNYDNSTPAVTGAQGMLTVVCEIQ